jgi:hypothetical protein
VYAKNKANKVLSNYDKSFSSDDVKRFIDEVQLKNERKEFNMAVCNISKHITNIKGEFETNLGIKHHNSLTDNSIRKIVWPE